MIRSLFVGDLSKTVISCSVVHCTVMCVLYISCKLCLCAGDMCTQFVFVCLCSRFWSIRLSFVRLFVSGLSKTVVGYAIVLHSYVVSRGVCLCDEQR